MKEKFLNLTGHKNSPMITVFICIIIILMLISHGKSKEINKLEERIENQINFIDTLASTTCEEEKILVNNLYDEVSNLGMKLDSMQLKYDF